MKIFALVMIILIGCKSTGQIPKPPVVVISSDASYIPIDTSHIIFKVIPSGIAYMSLDTLVIDLSKLVVSGGGTLPVHSTVPKFQRQIAIVNQKTFTFILPQTYFVVKNGIVIDKDITYTSIINGPNVIFTIPSTKTGDVIKIISLDY